MQSERMLALGDNHPMRRPEIMKVIAQKTSERMLNGGAAYVQSFVKNPSKPQVELFKLVKSVYLTAILNYQSLNRLIDIAIPNKMIAIEYDGSYWHQNQEADDIRQKELEAIGWKFLRYKDYVPDLNELKGDIKQLCQ